MTTSTETTTDEMPLSGNLIISMQAKQKRILIGAVAGLIAFIGLARFAFVQWAYEETDDAHTAANSAVLASKVGGVVSEILVHENQRVKEGDLLVKIDPRDFQNRIDQVGAELGSLQATVRNAKKDHLRMKTLLASDSVYQQQADAAQSKFLELSRKEASLSAQLKQAELDLEYSAVKAPTAGRVGRRAIEKGTVVASGQPLIAFVQSTEYISIDQNAIKGYEERFVPGLSVIASVRVR